MEDGADARPRLATLTTLAGLADELGAPALAAEAHALAERLDEGRFYVVCVGQFKRGKSTLLNALVGELVLPVGVVPITSAVTVLRHGERLAARVRFDGRDWEDCDPGALTRYVAEEENPGNEKGVAGVEVFVPSPLLATGMCLVDTPGLGSVSAANTAATWAFVPHLDAALVVLGTDPPISGEELALLREVAAQVDDLILVLNKADLHPEAARRDVGRFTARVLAETLGRAVGPLLEVSATERLAGTGPGRDWKGLVARLAALASGSGADLVRAAERRGVATLIAKFLHDLDEQRAALVRPLEESEARVAGLRSAVAAAERALEDLGHRLTAAQERLARAFTAERDGFFARTLPEARRELEAAIGSERAAGAALRVRAVEHADAIARRWLDRWRREQEPRAGALYEKAMARFVALVNEFQGSLAGVPGLGELPSLGAEVGFRTRSRFRYTGMLRVAPVSARLRLLDLVPGRRRRLRAVERAAGRYLERLLEVNSARLTNDFEARVVESRRVLETELRDRLRELAASAERALESARQARAAGAAGVSARLERLGRLRERIEALRSRSE